VTEETEHTEGSTQEKVTEEIELSCACQCLTAAVLLVLCRQVCGSLLCMQVPDSSSTANFVQASAWVHLAKESAYRHSTMLTRVEGVGALVMERVARAAAE
jgi:hypothetical protein